MGTGGLGLTQCLAAAGAKKVQDTEKTLWELTDLRRFQKAGHVCFSQLKGPRRDSHDQLDGRPMRSIS